jgi:hypothetical protein
MIALIFIVVMLTFAKVCQSATVYRQERRKHADIPSRNGDHAWLVNFWHQAKPHTESVLYTELSFSMICDIVCANGGWIGIGQRFGLEYTHC